MECRATDAERREVDNTRDAMYDRRDGRLVLREDSRDAPGRKGRVYLERERC
jgi:hypothetical protein